MVSTPQWLGKHVERQLPYKLKTNNMSGIERHSNFAAGHTWGRLQIDVSYDLSSLCMEGTQAGTYTRRSVVNCSTKLAGGNIINLVFSYIDGF